MSSRHKRLDTFSTNPDVLILFVTKGVRLFSYGSLAVPLFIYLKEIGINEYNIGLLLTLIMVGDLFITMLLTSCADKIGRRRTLAIGALLKLFTGIVFSLSDNFFLLALSGIFGVISMSGSEIGPFLSVEQAALTDICEHYYKGDREEESMVAEIFGWYNLVGYTCQAMGALFAGYAIDFLKSIGTPVMESHRFILYTYAFWGLVKWVLYNELSDDVELSASEQQLNIQQPQNEQSQCCAYGIKRKETFKMVLILSLIFSLDAFGGGFIVNSFISYWFSRRWEISESLIGTILMICSIVGAVGGVISSRLVKRFGAMQTMLITHIPASLLIIFIPLMPTKLTTVIIMVMRFSMSNMNLSARQTYVATLVKSDERSAAGGISNIARSFGLSFSPIILGKLMQQPTYSIWFSMPFYLGGSIRLLYDLLIWIFYRTLESQKKRKGRLKYTGITSSEDDHSQSLILR